MTNEVDLDAYACPVILEPTVKPTQTNAAPILVKMEAFART